MDAVEWVSSLSAPTSHLMLGQGNPKRKKNTLLWELAEAAGFNGEDQAEDEITWTRTE
jgi:hypothetical protein